MATNDKITPENIAEKVDETAQVIDGVRTDYRLFRFMVNARTTYSSAARQLRWSMTRVKKYFEVERAKQLHERADRKDTLDKLSRL